VSIGEKPVLHHWETSGRRFQSSRSDQLLQALNRRSLRILRVLRGNPTTLKCDRTDQQFMLYNLCSILLIEELDLGFPRVRN
jgi:hypothetical protein